MTDNSSLFNYLLSTRTNNKRQKIEEPSLINNTEKLQSLELANNIKSYYSTKNNQQLERSTIGLSANMVIEHDLERGAPEMSKWQASIDSSRTIEVERKLPDKSENKDILILTKPLTVSKNSESNRRNSI